MRSLGRVPGLPSDLNSAYPVCVLVRRVLAAWLIACACVVTGACAQPALQSEGFLEVQPSTTPTLGVPVSDLRTADLAQQLRDDPRVPASLREVLVACPDCMTLTTTWRDVTSDGRDDAIMTFVDSGATWATVIWAIHDGRTAPVFSHVGRHGAVTVESGDLVLTRQMYAAEDSECCPSGTPLVSRFQWRDGRFVQVVRTGGSPGTSFFDPNDKVIL